VHGLQKLFYDESESNVEQVKYAANKCGVVGNKLLQFIMMNDGFISTECKKHFGHIFEDCVTHDWAYTEEQFLCEFKRSIYDVFEIQEADKTPIGSGTIGQVYKFFHREKKVFMAVKIRHPKVEEQARRFVSNILSILNLVEKVKRIPFSILIKEFLKNIYSQLDYAVEVKNTKIMKALFKKETNIIIPTIYDHTPTIILMSYHEGVSFNELTDETERNRVSCDLYLFIVSSILIYDCIHCDLHYGNWKVSLPDLKLVVYDCGIIGRTYMPEVNERVVTSIFNSDYMELADIIVPDLHKYKKCQKIIQELMEKPYVKATERFSDFIKHMLLNNVKVDTNILKCVQGGINTISTIAIKMDKVNRILKTTPDNCREISISYNYLLLKRLGGKYTALKLKLEEWLQKNSHADGIFKEWLNEFLGHEDEEVFMDVVMQQLKM
jgi:predicted unusual protein kinase regulating ubiquinone biosynthesis (AarF/ABC1/UbiB family)